MYYKKLKEKYQATDYRNDIACNPLSYILRKAEIGYNLSSIEWEWLEQVQLRKTIEIIESQENYRRELLDGMLIEQSQLSDQYKDFTNPITEPHINFCLSFVLYKISNQEKLTENDIVGCSKENRNRTNFDKYNEYIRLKYKYSLIENIPFSNDALKILRKIDNDKKLPALDIEWLIEHKAYSVFTALKNAIAGLKVKYGVINDADECFAEHYLVLQKLEENRSLTKQDIDFLKFRQLNETLDIAQKLEFAWLKRFYKATIIEDSSFNQHLYTLLKKLRDGLLLSEADINYLKKRKLLETIEIACKPHRQLLENKIRSGAGLNPEDQVWCEKFQYFGLLFMALKAKYDVRDYPNQSPQSPLYSILQKLERKERLNDDNIVWLKGEELFKPAKKIFTSHYELEAVFAEQEHQRTKNQWFLANASSYWRKAEEPKKALHLTEKIDFTKIKEAKLKQALLTTRGGALRDIDDLDGAERCALHAIEFWSKSHNPYTLLGAICYATGRYEEGQDWFEEARKRGATESDEDIEIKRILQKTKDKKKLQEFIDFLIKKNPIRYAWVKNYGKKN